MNAARDGISWRALVLMAMGVAGLLMNVAPTAVAQDVSPVESPAATIGEPVPPEACTVARRSRESLMGLEAMATPSPTESATPAAFTLPEGTAASPEVVSAITAVLIQSVACANAGDTLRQFSILSDSYVATLIMESGLPGLSPAIYDALATPVPGSPSAWARIDAIDDVQVLLDGRIGAVVTTTGIETDRSFVVFVERDGAFLIDRLTRITPEEATPAA